MVGGDLSRADKLHLCLTVFGQAEKTLLRGEAQPGDVIFLIGRTGLARAGLLLLEERGRAALNEWPIPCEAHLRPAPRLKEGMRLSRLAADWGREKGDPTCGRLGLMDLSDGLARDLPRLVGPGMGADIDMPMPHTEILRFMRSRNEAEPVAAAKRHALPRRRGLRAHRDMFARACRTRHGRQRRDHNARQGHRRRRDPR